MSSSALHPHPEMIMSYLANYQILEFYQRVSLPRQMGEHVLLGAGQLLPHLLVDAQLREVSNVGWNLRQRLQ